MKKREKHFPMRTCISCGKKDVKYSLIRFVLNDLHEVKLDRKGSMPGRGAYTCRRQECIESAMQERILRRAFRKPGPFICRFCGSNGIEEPD